MGAHIVWGEGFAEKLTELVGVSRECVFIAGNPKIDLARRMQSQCRGDREGSKVCVLAVSNFTLADYDDESWRVFMRRHSI
ncbi:hypothetical protein DF186_22605, partial [Enterococcus hirae]